MASPAAPVVRLRISAAGAPDVLAAARAVRDDLQRAGHAAELLWVPGGTTEDAASAVRTGDADVLVCALADSALCADFERVAMLEREAPEASAVNVPAPGAGAIGLFMRPGDAHAPAAARLHHAPTARDVAFEQAVVAACAGTPFDVVGAHVFSGAMLAAVLQRGSTRLRRAVALHATSDATAIAQRLLEFAASASGKRILLSRTAEETSPAFRSRVEEAGWTIVHEPLIAFAPSGNPVPAVAEDDRRTRWVWVHSPQAAAHGLPAELHGTAYKWACSSRAAAAALPAGCHPDWIGHGAPGEAMREFAGFVGPLGPADVLIPHSDSSVPRWEEAFGACPAIRLHAWLAYAATNRDEGALPPHDAAVLTGPAVMKAWKHRMGLNVEGAGGTGASGATTPVVVAVGAATADAARDLGCAPHAVSEEAGDEAVWSALVWAMAVEADGGA